MGAEGREKGGCFGGGEEGVTRSQRCDDFCSIMVVCALPAQVLVIYISYLLPSFAHSHDHLTVFPFLMARSSSMSALQHVFLMLIYCERLVADVLHSARSRSLFATTGRLSPSS